jgi:hypothetical protein
MFFSDECPGYSGDPRRSATVVANINGCCEARHDGEGLGRIRNRQQTNGAIVLVAPINKSCFRILSLLHFFVLLRLH